MAACLLSVSLRAVTVLRCFGTILVLISSLFLATNSGRVHAMLAAAVYPYELAYREAAIIIQGDVISYDPKQGGVLRVQAVLRGDALVGTEYSLDGSSGYSFLASQPRNVTAFISEWAGQRLRLWQGPTSGGLIWSEPGLFALIAGAYANPRTALQGEEPRGRLAGAYYLATGMVDAASSRPSRAELDIMMDSVAWGMNHGSPSTHQAAVDTLNALGYSLETIGIAYHPLFKAEVKENAAQQLRAWWAGQQR